MTRTQDTSRLRRRAAGFTLLEVLAATVLIALLAAFFYAPSVMSKIQDFQRHQADVVAEELNRVGVAAQHWTLDEGGGSWPGATIGCASLFERLASQLSQFRGARNPKTAFHRAGYMELPTASSLVNSVELGRYYPSCSGERMILEVFFDADDARWARYITNRMAGAIADDLGEDYDRVVRLRSVWLLPAVALRSDEYVSKTEPEFEGALRSNIDLGGRAVYGASDVVLHNGHSLGKSFLYAAVVSHNDTVPKPTCAPGLSPQILASFKTMKHGNGKPIHYAEVYTEDIELENVPHWRVKAQILSYPETSNIRPSAYIRINVLVRCS